MNQLYLGILLGVLLILAALAFHKWYLGHLKIKKGREIELEIASRKTWEPRTLFIRLVEDGVINGAAVNQYHEVRKLVRTSEGRAYGEYFFGDSTFDISVLVTYEVMVMRGTLGTMADAMTMLEKASADQQQKVAAEEYRARAEKENPERLLTYGDFEGLANTLDHILAILMGELEGALGEEKPEGIPDEGHAESPEESQGGAAQRLIRKAGQE